VAMRMCWPRRRGRAAARGATIDPHPAASARSRARGDPVPREERAHPRRGRAPAVLARVHGRQIEAHLAGDDAVPARLGGTPEVRPTLEEGLGGDTAHLRQVPRATPCVLAHAVVDAEDAQPSWRRGCRRVAAGQREDDEIRTRPWSHSSSKGSGPHHSLMARGRGRPHAAISRGRRRALRTSWPDHHLIAHATGRARCGEPRIAL
jgi:hypothetical protein